MVGAAVILSMFGAVFSGRVGRLYMLEAGVDKLLFYPSPLLSMSLGI